MSVVSGKQPASCKFKFFGNGITCFSLTFTYSAYPPPPRIAQTWSPKLKFFTDFPNLVTIPEHSNPIISLSPEGGG